MRTTREQKYRVPEKVVHFLLHDPEPVEENVQEIMSGLRAMQLNPMPETRFEASLSNSELEILAKELLKLEGVEGALDFVRSVVVVGDPLPGEEVKAQDESLINDYAATVFNCTGPLERPIRGPFGEATIELKPGAQPVI